MLPYNLSTGRRDRMRLAFDICVAAAATATATHTDGDDDDVDDGPSKLHERLTDAPTWRPQGRHTHTRTHRLDNDTATMLCTSLIGARAMKTAHAEIIAKHTRTHTNSLFASPMAAAAMAATASDSDGRRRWAGVNVCWLVRAVVVGRVRVCVSAQTQI